MARTGIPQAEVLASMVRFPVQSRKDLGDRLQRSKASVSRLVDKLIETGLIVEGAKQASEGGRGRKTTSLHVRPDMGYFVGADFHGLAVRACVLDCSCQVLARGKRAVSPSWPMKRTVRTWLELIDDVVRRSGVDRQKVVGLGVGVPGVLKTDEMKIQAYLPPGRRADFSIGPELQKLGFPLAAANNTLCIAEYERRLGMAKDAPAFVSLLVRYGIGAVLFANDAFLMGDGLFSGELGHTTIDMDGRECICGRRGCLDAYCSGRTFDEYSDRGDKALQAELCKRGKYLGMGLANLIKIVHSPLVIVNGVYNDHEDTVGPALREELRAELDLLALPMPEVLFGDPLDGKTSIGAALRAADAFLVNYLTT